jgi:Ser/Thr protein kinase RdoA (MazF antagonist)
MMAVSGDVLGTPAPVIDLGRIAPLVEEVWGLRTGAVRPLASERDANILLDGRYVLKVSNPAEDPAVVDMENTAMSHAARVAADLPLPSVLLTVSGASVARELGALGDLGPRIAGLRPRLADAADATTARPLASTTPTSP